MRWLQQRIRPEQIRELSLLLLIIAAVIFFGSMIDGYYTSEIGLRQELGDDGQLFLAKFAGCDHPEHQG